MRNMVATLLLASLAGAQTPGPDVKQYVSVDAPVVALTHIRVIDGTGAPAREDQTIVISGGKIQAVGPNVPVPSGAKVMDLRGYTVLPGLVGMHNHLYYTAFLNRDAQGHTPSPGPLINEILYTAPRLYLASGVTTMRTTGSLEPYADLNLKRSIDAGQTPGPKIDVTAPYLEGKDSFFPQMHELTDAADARRLVNYWAENGATSYKAYMKITRDELSAAVEEAHKRKQKITGHLCSVTWREAAAIGIDDLEHGPVFTDSEFVKDKQPDACPPGPKILGSWENIDVASAPVQEMIRDLIAHHVAVTSTLPVFELLVPGRPPLQQRMLDAMSPESRVSYLAQRARGAGDLPWGALLKKEEQFELAFAKAGGLLLAGPDPTGIGGVLPGFGDQREVELLVEAGFTPVESIHIATANGAEFLGRAEQVRTIAPGKQADLLVIHGDPSKNIADIEKVETVFKDGIGYDSAKLIESVRGQVGIR